ncbi:MAG: phage portal protein family protein [Verrucomicrobiales bacterium]
MKTRTQFTVEARARARRWRCNPVAQIDATTLARHLDSFEAGFLSDAVAIWDHLEKRDDMLCSVITKRKKSVARHGWTVLPLPNLPPSMAAEARKHAAALEYFYQNLVCEHAMEKTERGGFKLLVRQMMDAVGKKFAVHEIVWKPVEADAALRDASLPRLMQATFRFVPLNFFENTTGELRYLGDETILERKPLEAGAWMITTGEGLMRASSTAWMFKNISLNDWLSYSERNGTPGLRGITAATRDSEEWTAMEETLVNLLEGQSVVHGTGDDIKVIDLAAGGQMPFPELVERIDRMLAALWRGADLSTISRDKGYGASLQGKEAMLLEEDDAEMISETLNQHVDQWVIRYLFGEEVKPLAQVKVLASPKESTQQDLEVDRFLLSHGAPLSLSETLQRYGRPMPKEGEALVSLKPAGKQMALQENQLVEECSIIQRISGSEQHLESEADDSANAAKLDNQWNFAEDAWVQISPFGDFPHGKGLQRMDKEAARRMVAQFESLLGRMGRMWGGAPFFLGHPDMPGAHECADRKAYGWITALKAADDGLYGQVRWSKAGIELIRAGHFRFLSPYWEAEEIGTEAGRKVLRPVRLISVGLTNVPNIPVKPLANEQTCEINLPAETGLTQLTASLLHGVELEKAIVAGRALPCEAERWKLILENEGNEAITRLQNLPSRLNIEPKTVGLNQRRGSPNKFKTRQTKFLGAVREKMRKGLSYDEAWEQTKMEQPAWFGVAT